MREREGLAGVGGVDFRSQLSHLQACDLLLHEPPCPLRLVSSLVNGRLQDLPQRLVVRIKS